MEFMLPDMKLTVSDQHLSPWISRMIKSGQYERIEVDAIKRHLRAGDRVLEIGGGIGYTTVLAAGIVGGEQVVTVEASPAMIPEIERNLENNGILGLTLIHGAAVGTGGPDSVKFFVADNYLASSLGGNLDPVEHEVLVPAVKIAEILEKHRPTVIICDAEGAEVGIFSTPLPACVRLITLELHPHIYGQKTMRLFFEQMTAEGFSYCVHGSSGAVVCLVRDDTVVEPIREKEKPPRARWRTGRLSFSSGKKAVFSWLRLLR